MSYNTPDHTLKADQIFRLREGIVETASILGTSIAEDIGFEAGIPRYPLAPEGAAGYLLRNAGDDIVALLNRANFKLYQGISEIAAASSENMSVRYGGIVHIPVGAVAVAAGDFVQGTPQIDDGVGTTTAKANNFDGDIIPAFSIQQIVVPVAAYTADAAESFPGGLEVLKILSAKFHLGSLAAVDSVTSTLTVVADGFGAVAGAAVTAAGEIALVSATQGQFGTSFQCGDSFTDGLFVIEAWVKSSTSALAPWFVGHALAAGIARIDATDFVLVPVILRGY